MPTKLVLPEASLGRAEAHAQPSAMDKAYAAGFFDGEGYITIAANHRAHNTKGTIYNMRVGVAQNDIAPLLWLRARWGGSVQAKKRRTTSGNTTYVWCCFALRAAAFLRDVRPRLIVKAERADLALAFQASLFNCGARGHTDAYRQRLAQFHAELASLNTHKPT